MIAAIRKVDSKRGLVSTAAESLISLRLLKVLPRPAGHLFENKPGKHVAATEFDCLFHQLKENVLAFLAFLANDGFVFHARDEFPIVQVCSCPFACSPQFGYPGGRGSPEVLFQLQTLCHGGGPAECFSSQDF